MPRARSASGGRHDPSDDLGRPLHRVVDALYPDLQSTVCPCVSATHDPLSILSPCACAIPDLGHLDLLRRLAVTFVNGPHDHRSVTCAIGVICGDG